MTSIRLLAAALVLSLAGCGFHLRGTSGVDLSARSVVIQDQGAPSIAVELRRELSYAQVPVTGNVSQADLIVRLSGEQYDQRVLSVDPSTGKVREYEIGYQVTLTVTRPDGTLLAEAETIDLLRDYTFDEGSVLGTFAQEGVIRQEILRDAAQSVMRRLESLDIN